MALNPTVLWKERSQSYRGVLVAIQISPTGNYATGGEALSFTTAGFGGTKLPIAWWPSACISTNAVMYIPTGSRDTGKLRYNVAAGTEKTNASAYSNDSCVILFLFPANP